jgi:hypothetical protein
MGWVVVTGVVVVAGSVGFGSLLQAHRRSKQIAMIMIFFMVDSFRYVIL